MGRRPDNATRDRLPPGQNLVEDFPVLTAGATPRVSTDTWSFSLRHGIRPVLHWTWQAFQQVLLYSARNWAEVVFAEELVGRLDGAGGFACRFALTREAASRDQDFSRRIDVAMLREVIGSRSDIIRNVYICGSNAFVGAAETAALGAGIEPDTIRTERYGS